MSASSRLAGSVVPPTAERISRAAAIAQAWLGLGDAVAPLSNGTGRPLARTTKLILEPLVIRPVQRPHLAGLTVDAEAATALNALIVAAGPDLAATAAWFLALKRARRGLRITEGNPQEKYFQRCYELARQHGAPEPGASDAVAEETVIEIAAAGGESLLTQVRALLQDPVSVDRLHDELVAAWKARPAEASTAPGADVWVPALDACATASVPDLAPLVAGEEGSAASAGFEAPGAARSLGLTAHDRLVMPAIGISASKRDLPVPFDRSVFERLFAALSGSSAHEVEQDAQDVVAAEIARTAAAWELAEEVSRVVLALGVEASHALEPTELLRPTNAHRLLSGRWQREAYVRRALRLPAEVSGVPETIRDDIRTVRQGYLRRLWVRLHGRELRGLETSGEDLWDTLDGVLRSVIMDQRHRLKLAIGRELEGAA